MKGMSEMDTLVHEENLNSGQVHDPLQPCVTTCRCCGRCRTAAWWALHSCSPRCTSAGLGQVAACSSHHTPRAAGTPAAAVEGAGLLAGDHLAVLQLLHARSLGGHLGPEQQVPPHQPVVQARQLPLGVSPARGTSARLADWKTPALGVHCPVRPAATRCVRSQASEAQQTHVQYLLGAACSAPISFWLTAARAPVVGGPGRQALGAYRTYSCHSSREHSSSLARKPSGMSPAHRTGHMALCMAPAPRMPAVTHRGAGEMAMRCSTPARAGLSSVAVGPCCCPCTAGD